MDHDEWLKARAEDLERGRLARRRVLLMWWAEFIAVLLILWRVW